MGEEAQRQIQAGFGISKILLMVRRSPVDVVKNAIVYRVLYVYIDIHKWLFGISEPSTLSRKNCWTLKVFVFTYHVANMTYSFNSW